MCQLSSEFCENPLSGSYIVLLTNKKTDKQSKIITSSVEVKWLDNVL